jgi:hypothetical protein
VRCAYARLDRRPSSRRCAQRDRARKIGKLVLNLRVHLLRARPMCRCQPMLSAHIVCIFAGTADPFVLTRKASSSIRWYHTRDSHYPRRLIGSRPMKARASSDFDGFSRLYEMDLGRRTPGSPCGGDAGYFGRVVSSPSFSNESQMRFALVTVMTCPWREWCCMSTGTTWYRPSTRSIRYRSLSDGKI